MISAQANSEPLKPVPRGLLPGIFKIAFCDRALDPAVYRFPVRVRKAVFLDKPIVAIRDKHGHQVELISETIRQSENRRRA